MRFLRWAPAPALVVFLGLHLLDLGLYWYFGDRQAPLTSAVDPLYPPQRAGDGLGGILSSWDGQWYQRIAEEGYPRHLPEVDGDVVQNAWAFFPAVPLTARAIMELTGLPFAVAGSAVDLACATGAVVVLHRIVAEHSSPAVATWTVIGLSIAPASPVLVMTYTEGPALLVVLLALRALQQRRYGAVCGWTVLLGLVRPIAPVIGLVAAVIALARHRNEGLPRRHLRGTLAVVGVACLAFALWPACAALVTGRWDAYTITQTNWLGGARSLQDRSWLIGALSLQRPERTLLVGLGGAALLGLLLRRAAVRAWPLELRGWALGYALFIAATTRPVTSVVRYLLLTVVPWWPAPGIAERPVAVQRVAVVVALLAGAVLHTWWIGGYVRTTVTGPSSFFP